MSTQTITLSLFLEKLREIAAENPKYRSGGSGKDGTCECIGLLLGRSAGPAATGREPTAATMLPGMRPEV